MNIIDIINEKPSAYRSMKLAKMGLTKPTTKDTKGNLQKWTNEKWLNLNALLDKKTEIPCGTKYKGQIEPTVCRPKKKVDKKTPTPLAYDLTKDQIKKAIKLKIDGKRVNWKQL
jgi:hypothetical protein